jgi:cyclase
MKRVTDSIHVETGFRGANVGCVLTEQGAVLIDTPMLPEEARQLQDELGRIGSGEIAYIVYSHQHFDHVMGSAFLTRKTIACRAAVSGIQYLVENLEKEVALIFPDLYEERPGVFRGWEIVMPQISFSRELSLHMGNKSLELAFVGGHSSASILVTVPEERVLFTGDNLVTGMLPVTANCRFDTWIDLLRKVEDMEVDTIVPGHGDPCGKEQVRRVRVYFEAMRDRVRPLVASGATREDVARVIDLRDASPVPLTEEMMPQVRFDVSRMFDQIKKGYL